MIPLRRSLARVMTHLRLCDLADALGLPEEQSRPLIRSLMRRGLSEPDARRAIMRAVERRAIEATGDYE